MFQRPLEKPGETVSISFEGLVLTVPAGESVAAALTIANVGATRTAVVSGAPRGAYCLMGVCFECLMIIDGVPDRQACLVTVRDGMTVRRQTGAGRIGGGEAE